MTETPDGAADDFETARKITELLKPFNKDEQERIIRWAKEKLGLPLSSEARTSGKQEAITAPSQPTSHNKHTRDIKTFINEKNPTSGVQFATAVAYYYRFEAPEGERKDFIVADDLQDACRKVGRQRLKKPNNTLHNAHRKGYLDKTGEKGSFSINTVGENLVAMTLPSGMPQKTYSRIKVSKKTESMRTKKSKGK